MADREKSGRFEKGIYALFLICLILYPLGRICFGADLWDGGYNYANFRYSGTEYMDSMWYFATWTATETGSLLMKLPFGGTMLAMNLYTGLFVSLLATAGFLFCTKKLKLPPILAFLGELTACGLCWLPTASLYNYLTFVLLLFGSILLYRGLTEERDGFLAAAGVLLGLNVGVRFSNLVQAGLILAVWGYAFMKKKSLKETVRQTLICVAGYLAALGAFLLFIGIRYGFGEYVDSVVRLFAMTETAEDYAPASMLTGVLEEYVKAGYWVKRFALALAVGTAVCIPLRGKAVKVKKLFSVAVTLALFGWLLTHRFFYPDFASYQSVYDPCVMLLLAAVCVSCFFLIKKDILKEDKLLAVMEILTVLLTSLGGNNAIFYCINNMFLIMPLFIYMVWKLWKEQKNEVLVSMKTIAAGLLLLVCVLSVKFHSAFTYEEAAGARNMDTVITEIPVLKGIRTNSEKAESLTGLYEYLTEHRLGDRSCILYGQIPGISYFMELSPAINIWSDLESYTCGVMESDLQKLSGKLEAGETDPLVILEKQWAEYLETGQEPDILWGETTLRKAELLKEFMEAYGYERSFSNEKYAVYERE